MDQLVDLTADQTITSLEATRAAMYRQIYLHRMERNKAGLLHVCALSPAKYRLGCRIFKAVQHDRKSSTVNYPKPSELNINRVLGDD
jgi:hypothetical protein